MKNNSEAKLILYGLLMEICYLALHFVFPIKELVGDDNLVPRDNQIFSIIVTSLLLSFVVYCCAWREILINGGKVKIIFIFFILFNITLFFIKPITSSDIYSYINQSRIFSIHHANPLTHPYDDFKKDLFFSATHNRWSFLASIYGPLFIYLSAPFTFIFKNDIFLTLFSLKAFFVLLNILTFWLIRKITKEVISLFAYAWNPYILYEVAVNGHNVIMLLFFIILGIFFMVRKEDILKNKIVSLNCFFLAVMIKAIAVILPPILFFFYLNRKKEIN